MTFLGFKNLTKGFLTGDRVLPADDEVIKMLLETAFLMISSKTEVLRLLTLHRDQGVLRLSEGRYMVRFPELPTKDEDPLDIDHELAFAASRYVASFISADLQRVIMHEERAGDIIDWYTSKVDGIMQQIREKEDGAGGYEAYLPLGNA